MQRRYWKRLNILNSRMLNLAQLIFLLEDNLYSQKEGIYHCHRFRHRFDRFECELREFVPIVGNYQAFISFIHFKIRNIHV